MLASLSDLDPNQSETRVTLHASAVLFNKKAVLIVGPSGTGKSTLALELLARGASLIADDQCILERRADAIWLHAPQNLPAAIEVRNFGLLGAEMASGGWLHLIVDMTQVESERLPARHVKRLWGQDITCVHKIEGPHFPAAIVQYIKAGRMEPET